MRENILLLSDFFYTVYLASCGAMGLVPKTRSADWKQVLEIAMKQKVIAMVYLALLKNRCGCPDDVFSTIESISLRKMIRNAFKQEKIDQLMTEAYHQGIQMAIMKGIIVAECYDDPLIRSSSDLDLIVNPKEKKRAFQFLISQGMTCIDRHFDNGHYGVFRDRIIGSVELHDEIYVKINNDNWFPNASLIYEPIHFIDAENHFAIDCTQHFNLLCDHLLRHFVSGNITIQMCIDLEMYYRKNSSKIDIQKIKQELTTIDGIKLISAIINLLRQSGIDTETPFDEIDSQIIDNLADDIYLGSGNVIVDDKELLVRYAIRNKRIKQKHTILFVVWQKARNFVLGIASYFFPYPDKIKNAYPNKNFLSAYFLYVRKSVKNRLARTNQKTLDNEIKRREKLLKELDLL